MGLKNIEKAQVLRLGDEVEYQQGPDCEQDARAKPQP